MEDGEKPYEDEEQGSDAGSAFDHSSGSDADGYEAEGWSAAVAALPEDQEFTGADNEEPEDTLTPVSAGSAGLATKSTKLMETYAAVAVELQRVGAVALAANVVKEQRKRSTADAQKQRA